MMRVISFCACLVLLLATAAGCSLMQRGEQSSPHRLVEAYLQAFQNDDFEQMIALSGGWEGSSEELDFARRLVEMIELNSYSIDHVEMVSKTEALVQITVTLSLMGQEKTQTNRLRVQKEEGKWYLSEGLLE